MCVFVCVINFNENLGYAFFNSFKWDNGMNEQHSSPNLVGINISIYLDTVHRCPVIWKGEGEGLVY